MNPRSLAYHLHSIWLFTYSDLKTIVGPKTAFGLLNASRAHVFGISPAPSLPQLLSRLPIVALWTWINLLPFAIGNQRQPAATDEDTLNKPWRPLPAGRLSPEEAKRLMLGLYLVAILLSTWIGGSRQCLLLVALGYWYNDCSGADRSSLVRNFINACGFLCYTCGAMEVALASTVSLEPALMRWFTILGAVVFSTVQTQDMYDQACDSSRNRKTVPLVLGDGPARWSIAIPMAFWSWFVPWYWDMGVAGYVSPLLLGYSVVYRTFAKRSVSDDKMTFRIWNTWMVTLYALPLLK